MNMAVEGSVQRDKSKPAGMSYLCPVSFTEETVGMHIIKGWQSYAWELLLNSAGMEKSSQIQGPLHMHTC